MFQILAMIQPIRTWYREIEFRSKLEADWAEYFDFEEIDWHYEPESYMLSDGRGYLPDFFLPELDIFVEIKGVLSSDLSKPAMFFAESGKPILIGLPDGNFFYIDHYYFTQSKPIGPNFMSKAMERNDYEMMKKFQREVSCFISLESENVDLKKYFSNHGFDSPEYCGSKESGYWNSIKDHSDKDGRDIRANYYGGLSTWEQRGFTRKRWSKRMKSSL